MSSKLKSNDITNEINKKEKKSIIVLSILNISTFSTLLNLS
jgi:hypothetical protein